MEVNAAATREIITMSSLREEVAEDVIYSLPGVQKWALIIGVNALMLLTFSILFVFLLHQKEFTPLIYKFTDLISTIMIALVATAISILLDFLAMKIYWTTGRAPVSRRQMGQIIDYSSFFLAFLALAILGWAGFCFLRALVSVAPLLVAMAA